MNKFFAKLFMKIMGWKVDTKVPDVAYNGKTVMIAAPHTSNWDFLFTKAAFTILNIDVRMAVKKEVMVFPLKYPMQWMRVLPIDRSPKKKGGDKKSTVEAMADLFNGPEKLVVAIAAEGTRSWTPKWRSGFYHAAVMAKVPITLGYLDYKKKIAGVGPIIHPSGDFEADMKIIAAFYKDISPLYPKLFNLEPYL